MALQSLVQGLSRTRVALDQVLGFKRTDIVQWPGSVPQHGTDVALSRLLASEEQACGSGQVLSLALDEQAM